MVRRGTLAALAFVASDAGAKQINVALTKAQVLACDYRSLNDGSSPMGLPFVPPLAAFEYGAV